MAAVNPFAQYQQNAVLNARPGQLVLMSFNGILKFAKQADLALEDKDLPRAHNALVRAQDIVSYLRGTLNTDFRIGQDLDALYDYIHDRLVQANLKKDRETLAEVDRMVRALKEAWSRALEPNRAPEQEPMEPER
ncbi:MAG: flagellar export chaperone FliS [Bacillota bacterium]